MLLALAVICGAAPAMAGMPMAGMPMADMPVMGMSMNDMAMPCGQHAPAHKAPCDRQCCSCVLGFAALAGGPMTATPVSFATFRLSWLPALSPDGRTQKPALPPPRA